MLSQSNDAAEPCISFAGHGSLNGSDASGTPPPSTRDSPDVPEYRCQWHHPHSCNQIFHDPSSLYHHLTRDHVGRKLQNNLCLNCHWGDCQVQTLKRDHITSHLRIHVALKPYNCETCRRGFKRPQDLKKHRRVHQTESCFLENHDGPKQALRRDMDASSRALASSPSGLYRHWLVSPPPSESHNPVSSSGRFVDSSEHFAKSNGKFMDSRDRYADPRSHYVDSRDRYLDPRDRYVDSRDRCAGSRDHYPDSRDRYVDPDDRVLCPNNSRLLPPERDSRSYERTPDARYDGSEPESSGGSPYKPYMDRESPDTDHSASSEVSPIPHRSQRYDAHAHAHGDVYRSHSDRMAYARTKISALISHCSEYHPYRRE